MKQIVLWLTGLFWFAASAALASEDLFLTVMKGEETQGYSLEEIDKLTQVKVVTSNDFVDGKKTFEGPLARDIVLRIGGNQGSTIRLIAANDYEIEVDAYEFFAYDVILATRMEGELFPRRTKGPIWMIYPMSDHPELQDSSFNQRLIWQLIRIEVQ